MRQKRFMKFEGIVTSSTRNV